MANSPRQLSELADMQRRLSGGVAFAAAVECSVLLSGLATNFSARASPASPGSLGLVAQISVLAGAGFLMAAALRRPAIQPYRRPALISALTALACTVALSGFISLVAMHEHPLLEGLVLAATDTFAAAWAAGSVVGVIALGTQHIPKAVFIPLGLVISYVPVGVALMRLAVLSQGLAASREICCRAFERRPNRPRSGAWPTIVRLVAIARFG